MRTLFSLTSILLAVIGALTVLPPEASFGQRGKFVPVYEEAHSFRASSSAREDQMRQLSSARLNVSSMSTVSATSVWALARESLSSGLQREVVFRTANGGATWERHIIDFDGWFYDIFFVDSETGWIAGSHGSILKSTDAGQTWRRQQTSSQSALIDIQFVDRNHGWAMGEGGQILITTDGGEHWRGKLIPARHGLRALHFSDRLNGWAVGEEGEAHRSQDGGATWETRGRQVLSSIPKFTNLVASFRTVRFITPQAGFMIANVASTRESGSRWQAILLSTNDSGFSWTATVVPGDSGVLRAQLLSSADIWVVSGLGEKLLHTLDGGRRWSSINPVSDGGMVMGIQFSDHDLGWLVISYGTFSDSLFHTSDGGKTWAKVELPGGD